MNATLTQANGVLEELREVYTDRELRKIAQRSKEMKTEGYGRLTITFHNHHPHRIERALSEDLAGELREMRGNGQQR